MNAFRASERLGKDNYTFSYVVILYFPIFKYICLLYCVIRSKVFCHTYKNRLAILLARRHVEDIKWIFLKDFFCEIVSLFLALFLYKHCFSEKIYVLLCY